VLTNHYQNFSAEYLGRVLKAYSDYRGKELAKTQSKQLTDFSEAQIDKKQYYEEYLFMKYDALLKGKYIFTEEDERHLYRKLEKTSRRLTHRDSHSKRKAISNGGR